MAKTSKFVVIDYSDRFKLPIGRLAFHNLFTPVKFEEGQIPKYSARLFYEPSTDFTEYQAALKRLIEHPDLFKTFHNETGALKQVETENGLITVLSTVKKAIRRPTEDEVEKYAFYEGQLIAGANSTRAPGVLGPQREVIRDSEDIQRGCYGVLYVSLGYHKSAQQFYFALHAFQKARSGEPLAGGGGVDTNEFETFQDEVTVNDLMGI